jgi:hypothetical protein
VGARVSDSSMSAFPWTSSNRPELVRRDAVGLHRRRVGVAARAQLRDVERGDRGGRIRCLLDVVGPVAVDADGDPRVGRLGQALAVDAGPVLGVLVGRQAVGPHPLRVGMAAPAQADGLLAGGLPDEPLRPVHRDPHPVGRGIAAMAVGAGDAALAVDALLPRGRDEVLALVDDLVACQALVRLALRRMGDGRRHGRRRDRRGRGGWRRRRVLGASAASEGEGEHDSRQGTGAKSQVPQVADPGLLN